MRTTVLAKERKKDAGKRHVRILNDWCVLVNDYTNAQRLVSRKYSCMFLVCKYYLLGCKSLFSWNIQTFLQLEFIAITLNRDIFKHVIGFELPRIGPKNYNHEVTQKLPFYLFICLMKSKSGKLLISQMSLLIWILANK